MEGKDVKKESEQEQEYPGFRFQPTEEELVGFYLKRKSQGKLSSFRYIPVIDLYRYDPWELTTKEGAKEMYFFVEKDESSQRKCGRPNRIAATGYWKATGSDRSIWDDSTKLLGHKKTLVFYRGKAPRGEKTNWVMNEFRLPESQNEVVLCRIHKKATPQKWLEKQAYLNAQLQQQQQQQQQQQSRHNSSNCNSVSNNSHSYSDGKCPEESTATPEPESEDANSSKCNCSRYEAESMTAATTNTNTNTNSNNSNSSFINIINVEGPVHNGNLFSAAGLNNLEAILYEDVKPPLEIPINPAIIDWKFDAAVSVAPSSHISTSKPLPWEDLWSPSSLLCTPKDYSLGTPHFPKF